MKKFGILITAVLLNSMILNAQTDSTKIGDDGWEIDKPSKRKDLHLQDYLTINFGTSVPMGDLKNVGNAKTGLDLSIIYNAPCYNTYFGISFVISQDKNKFKGEDFFYSVANTPVLNYSDEGNTKSVSDYFLIGLYYTKPVGDKFAVDFRALIGADASHMPEIYATAVDAGGKNHILEYDGVNSFNAAYGAGVTLKYSITKKICCAVNVDYKYSRAKYESFTVDMVEQPNGTFHGDRENSMVSMKLSSVNASIGLGYIFGKK